MPTTRHSNEPASRIDLDGLAGRTKITTRPLREQTEDMQTVTGLRHLDERVRGAIKNRLRPRLDHTIYQCVVQVDARHTIT